MVVARVANGHVGGTAGSGSRRLGQEIIWLVTITKASAATRPTIQDHRATSLAAVCPIRARPDVFAGIRKALLHKSFRTPPDRCDRLLGRLAVCWPDRIVEPTHRASNSSQAQLARAPGLPVRDRPDGGGHSGWSSTPRVSQRCHRAGYALSPNMRVAQLVIRVVCVVCTVRRHEDGGGQG